MVVIVADSLNRYRWEFRSIFEDLVRRAGLDVRITTPHAMRHTFASILAQRGVSLYRIAQWMGHSTAEVTGLYARLTACVEDISRLKKPCVTEGPHAGVG